MDRKPKQLHLFSLALVGSILFGACHSSKKATKSSEENSPQYAYTPERENSPGNSSSPKDKPPAHKQNVSREGAIIVTYAEKLEVPKSSITNYQLYNFIDVWYGTPYKYGGRSKSGIDCSDFVSLLLQATYNTQVSGDVADLYKQCKRIKSSQLREGDLVFFKINKKSPSHVGVYLQNHKFVHASVHAGVIIDDLEEDYYKKYFYGAGRIIK